MAKKLKPRFKPLAGRDFWEGKEVFAYLYESVRYDGEVIYRLGLTEDLTGARYAVRQRSKPQTMSLVWSKKFSGEFAYDVIHMINTKHKEFGFKEHEILGEGWYECIMSSKVVELFGEEGDNK